MALAGWTLAAILAVLVWLLTRERKRPKPPTEVGKPIAKEKLEHAVAVWQKTVDVQQHFNQIEMDIRKTALTVILTVIGAAGYVAEKGMTVHVGSREIPVACVLLVAGAGAWCAFYFMDYGWYHRLLKGSVDQGMALERDLQASDVPIDLTNWIGRRSPIFLFRMTLHSDDKIKIFYRSVLVFIGALALISFFIKTPQPQTASEKKTNPPARQTP